MTRPRLLRNALTGRVYIVTEYSEDESGRIVARVKHDATDDFDALVAQLGGDE